MSWYYPDCGRMIIYVMKVCGKRWALALFSPPLWSKVNNSWLAPQMGHLSGLCRLHIWFGRQHGGRLVIPHTFCPGMDPGNSVGWHFNDGTAVVGFTDLRNWQLSLSAHYMIIKIIEILILCTNVSSMDRFLRIYNKSSLSPSIWVLTYIFRYIVRIL
jgi:hypothetical protein